MYTLTRRSFTRIAAVAVAGVGLPDSGRNSTNALRALGRNGLKVPPVGIGTNNFGSTLDAAGARLVVDAALDNGAAFFDTADVYGRGKSEEYLGQALGKRRPRALIATKFGGKMGGAQFPDGGASRGAVMYAAEQSLRRLGSDYIDLYQIHRPDPNVPIEETLRALEDLVRHGKARFAGHSNFDGRLADEAAKMSRANKIVAFTSAQNHYNLIVRDIEKDLVPACERNHVGILPYFPLESGLLTGKYKRGERPAEGTRLGTWAKQMPDVTGRLLSDEHFSKVERLEALGAEHGATLLEMAFGWLLSKPYVGSVIAGATKPAQVVSNVRAASWRPSAEIDKAIDVITLQT